MTSKTTLVNCRSAFSWNDQINWIRKIFIAPWNAIKINAYRSGNCQFFCSISLVIARIVEKQHLRSVIRINFGKNRQKQRLLPECFPSFLFSNDADAWKIELADTQMNREWGDEVITWTWRRQCKPNKAPITSKCYCYFGTFSSGLLWFLLAAINAHHAPRTFRLIAILAVLHTPINARMQ